MYITIFTHEPVKSTGSASGDGTWVGSWACARTLNRVIINMIPAIAICFVNPDFIVRIIKPFFRVSIYTMIRANGLNIKS